MSLIARGYESESEEEGEIEHGFVRQKLIQSKLRTIESSENGEQKHISKSQLESSHSGEKAAHKYSSSDAVRESEHHCRKEHHIRKEKKDKEHLKSREVKPGEEKERHRRDNRIRVSSRSEKLQTGEDDKSSVDVIKARGKSEKVQAEKEAVSKSRHKESSRDHNGKSTNDDTSHRKDIRRLSEKVKHDDRTNHSRTRDGDRNGKRSERDNERSYKDKEEKVYGDKEVRHNKNFDSTKEISKSSSRMKQEHLEATAEGQSSRLSQDKQPARSLSNSRPAELDRHSSPCRPKRSHSRTSPPSTRFEFHFIILSSH